MKLLWVYLSPCHYVETPIAGYQAAHDVAESLLELPFPQQERALLEISQRINDAVVEAEHEAEERKRQAELAARRRAEKERARQAELEAKRLAEAERKRQVELEAKRQAELEAKRQAEAKQELRAELGAMRRAEAARKLQVRIPLEATRQENQKERRLTTGKAKRRAEAADTARPVELEAKCKTTTNTSLPAANVDSQLDEEPTRRSKLALLIAAVAVLSMLVLLARVNQLRLDTPVMNTYPAVGERIASSPLPTASPGLQPSDNQKAEIPRPKAKRVPIPDPSPPGTEPIRIEDPKFDIGLQDVSEIMFGIPDAPTAAMPEGPIHITKNVKKPRKLSSPRPAYTEEAREKKVQGVVILQAIIDKKGNVTNVKVLKGLPCGLSEESSKKIMQWKFEPALLNGKPVEVYCNLTVNFRLE